MRVPLMLRLKYTAGRYLPFLKVAPPLDRQKLFQLRPLRNGAIEWELNAEGEALLTIPRRKDRVGRVVGFLFRVPETRATQLDEVGTFVWNLCDGTHSVENIVRLMCKQYKMNRREVEVSVAQYLRELTTRNYIGFYQRGGKTK